MAMYQWVDVAALIVNRHLDGNAICLETKGEEGGVRLELIANRPPSRLPKIVDGGENFDYFDDHFKVLSLLGSGKFAHIKSADDVYGIGQKRGESTVAEIVGGLLRTVRETDRLIVRGGDAETTYQLNPALRDEAFTDVEAIALAAQANTEVAQVRVPRQIVELLVPAATKAAAA